MAREIPVFDAYMPAIVLLFTAGAAITRMLDCILADTGLYRVVWHPSLFRASLLACICGVLGLGVVGRHDMHSDIRHQLMPAGGKARSAPYLTGLYHLDARRSSRALLFARRTTG
jgi:hypothetical protein